MSKSFLWQTAVAIVLLIAMDGCVTAPVNHAERCLQKISTGMNASDAHAILEESGFRFAGMSGNAFGKRSRYVHEKDESEITIYTDSKSIVTAKSIHER